MLLKGATSLRQSPKDPDRLGRAHVARHALERFLVVATAHLAHRHIEQRVQCPEPPEQRKTDRAQATSRTARPRQRQQPRVLASALFAIVSQ